MKKKRYVFSMRNLSHTIIPHFKKGKIIILCVALLVPISGCMGPMHTAVNKGDIKTVRTLLESGANINKREWDRNMTPLYLAVRRGDASMVRLLIENGANINDDIWNPLYYAAFYGYLDIVGILLDAGADPTIGRVGVTALQIAQKRGHTTIVRLLQEAEEHRYKQYTKVEKPSLSTFEKPSIKRDITPPSIIITSHKTDRGIKVIETLSRTRIEGKAIDPSGVAEVRINGEPSSLDAEGNFSGDVFLKVGENKILVTAMDTQENIARKDFVIKRTPKIAMLRKTDVSKAGDFGRFYALIIGSNNYKYLPELQTARNDAKGLDKILRERFGFETEVLLDATRSDILDSLNNFRKRLGPNDNFLMYYAGHGEFDKTATKAYWLPVDAKPDSDSNWIIVDTITSNIKRFSSRHVLVVADSCYSGTMTRSAITQISSRQERDKYLQKMLKKTSRTLIASGGNEPVADSGGEEHSIFAEVLLRALNAVDQKVFTAEELFYGFIKESVAGRAEQTPEYSIIRNSGHDGGDFLFVRD